MIRITEEMREATLEAMGALRASVPEVVVPSQNQGAVEPPLTESHWKMTPLLRAKISMGLVTVVVAVVQYLN